MSSTAEKVLIGGAAVFFIGATLAGGQMLFASADEEEETETCETQTVAAGETLPSNKVTVNIYNASNTAGLANRVRINLEKRGFLAGLIGNSESEAEPTNVAILTEDDKDPAVQLIARQFNGEVSFIEPDIPLENGVTVVLGPDYADLKKGAPAEIKAGQDVDVCVPTIDLEEPQA